MKNNIQIGNLGEIKIIELIEEAISNKTGKILLRDDSFFFNFKEENLDRNIVLNSDMLVSTTDVPPSMNFYQIGRKSVIMNLSDLLVKGVIPKGIIISFGLPIDLPKNQFMEIVNGIIDTCLKYDMEYIGGDINETKELIINPTIFGFKNPKFIIYRKGIKVGDVLISNNKFGLTGVGFNILLEKRGNVNNFSEYKRSIMSVLEPSLSENEAFILSENKLATASIDSSDGLYKSLLDLMFSNPNIGFEVEFSEDLIDLEAIKYSKEFDLSLEGLVLNGGEEFIHLFTIDSKNFNKVEKEIKSKGGQIFKIGRVISEESIFIIEEGKKKEIKNYGFEHFTKKA